MMVQMMDCRFNRMMEQPSCVTDIRFPLFQEFNKKCVQMNDRFGSVHIWSEELALKNKGRWTPLLISKAKYESEKLHPWNN